MAKKSKASTIFGNDQRYHKMVDEVQDYAILLLDRDGMIQNWNKGAEKIKGYTEKEILGKNFSIFYLPEDKQSGLPDRLITEAAVNGRATHEGWRIRKDGTAFWGYVVITALHDEDDNVIGFTKVTRDLTERKIAEDQMERDARSIALQNRQLEEFAYITSHDLQEPIRKIQTFAQLLEKNIDDKEVVLKYIGKINSSAERMVALIKDVLNFSRLSQAEELFTDTDLDALIKDIAEDFELLIEEKNVTIIASGLPVVYAIPLQMKQLFTNLISNAIKFNAGDPVITITAQAVKMENEAGPSEAEPYHKITVSDNGIGFEQQYADQAFQPFKRLTTSYGGTGIGLAMCKRIADNHKGDIQVESNPGTGTTFTILLPAGTAAML